MTQPAHFLAAPQGTLLAVVMVHAHGDVNREIAGPGKQTERDDERPG